MAQAVLITCLVMCCCSSLVAGGLAFPVPNSHTGIYDGFTEVAEGRVPFNLQGKAFTPGLEQNCYLNCDADFTCQGFSVWNQYGKLWCLKSTSKPNPWFAIPEGIAANKTGSKIFIKN
jgi:hypothetical protein